MFYLQEIDKKVLSSFRVKVNLLEGKNSRDDVHRDGEHDGAVVLGRDVVQSLKVSELKTSVTKTPHLGLSLTCKAPALEEMILAAFFRARLDFSSPSAAMILALASRAASASAAMALINCSGTLTSFSSTLSTVTPQGSVATSRVSYKVKLPTWWFFEMKIEGTS